MMSETCYSVYVINLSHDVLGEHKFRKANPLYVEGQPCVYVGSTACTPDERFQQHKHGYKHNRYAKDYGVELRQNDDNNALTTGNPHTDRSAAEAREQELTDTLRKKGWAVWSH